MPAAPRSLAGTRKARIAAVVVALLFGLVLAALRWGGVIGERGPATPRPSSEVPAESPLPPEVP